MAATSAIIGVSRQGVVPGKFWTVREWVPGNCSEAIEVHAGKPGGPTASL